MRFFLGVMVVLGALACGSPNPAQVEVQVGAQADDAALATAPGDVAAAPVEDRAPRMQMGIVYSGNMLGELEPCG